MGKRPQVGSGACEDVEWEREAYFPGPIRSPSKRQVTTSGQEEISQIREPHSSPDDLRGRTRVPRPSTHGPEGVVEVVCEFGQNAFQGTF